MTRSKGRRLLLCAAVAAFAAPAAANGDDPSTGGAQAPPAPATQSTVSASGAQVTVMTRAGTMLRKLARFRGNASTDHAGRTVGIERFDAETQTWSAVAATTIAADGSYTARWRADRVGEHRVRAVVGAGGQAVAATVTPELAITIHRPQKATWYGPRFYGRTTACGQRMSRTLLGVAHKTLPCGAKVALLYKGRRITVPVVDRGPFAHGAHWDLTAATAQALRFEHTDRVGAVRIATP